MTEVERPPSPYLSQEEVNDRLGILGFHIDNALDFPPGYQKAQFVALQELIAGAIVEWAGLEFDPPDAESEETAEAVGEQLREWTEGYLVG